MTSLLRPGSVLAAAVLAVTACGPRAGVRPFLRETAPPVVTMLTGGSWGWKGAEGLTCSDSPHRFSFSDDLQTMTLTHAAPIDMVNGHVREAVYEIRQISDNSITAFMIGETRRLPSGELVVWELVLLAPDVYRWRPANMHIPGFSTPDIVRCDQEQPRLSRRSRR